MKEVISFLFMHPKILENIHNTQNTTGINGNKEKTYPGEFLVYVFKGYKFGVNYIDIHVCTVTYCNIHKTRFYNFFFIIYQYI